MERRGTQRQGDRDDLTPIRHAVLQHQDFEKVLAVDGEVLEVEVARVRGEKVKLRVSLSRVDQLTKAGQSAGDDAQAKS